MEYLGELTEKPKHCSCDDTLRTLYSTNTIWIEREPMIQGMLRQGIVPGAPRLLSPSIALITSLEIRSQLVLWRGSSKHDEKDRALFAEQLDLLSRAFPNLRRLKWIPCHAIHSEHGLTTPVPSNQLNEVERLFLLPLLRASANLRQLRELIVPLAIPIFFGIVEHLEKSGRQSFAGRKIGDVRPWYPFTEQPGNPGPDGGGFWMEYSDHLRFECKWELSLEGSVRFIEP